MPLKPIIRGLFFFHGDPTTKGVGGRGQIITTKNGVRRARTRQLECNIVVPLGPNRLCHCTKITMLDFGKAIHTVDGGNIASSRLHLTVSTIKIKP